MIEKEDRIERCRQKFSELFGGEPVKDEGTDPEFMRILQRFIFGEVCYVGTLDNQMRELITVTVLAVNQTLPQLKAHTTASLNVGCTPTLIREAVYQCAPYIGFPKTLNAIGAMNEAFMESGIKLPLESQETVKDEERYAAGLAIQEAVYKTEIKDKYKDLPKEYAEAIPLFLTELGFGDIQTRSGMNIKQRELLTFIALAALGGADLQVASHANGAQKVGNTKEELLCALLHAMPYMGFPRMLNALNSIKNQVEER